jgi:hypothetical protein
MVISVAISDEPLLAYLFGTQEEIDEYIKKGKNDDSSFIFGYTLQSLLIGPVLLFTVPPLGIAVEADFLYRTGKGIWSKKCKGSEPSGLVGRVRELYKAAKS